MSIESRQMFQNPEPRPNAAGEPPLAIVHQLFTANEHVQHEDLPWLDDKEFHTLYYLARGHSSKDILYATGNKGEPIYRRYGVKNAVKAVGLAARHGVITPAMFTPEDFRLDSAHELNDEEIDILREVANPQDDFSAKAIAGRLAMDERRTKYILDSTRAKYELTTLPKTAAFYLFAVKENIIPGNTSEFVQDRHTPRNIRTFPGIPKLRSF